MTLSQAQQAIIDILPNHWVRLRPFVPEIYERLQYRVVKFTAQGQCGHQAMPSFSDALVEEGHYLRKRVQRVPQGIIPEVTARLEELGYTVKLTDQRHDSSNWILNQDWHETTPSPLRKVIPAISTHRALRIIASTIDKIADIITTAKCAYPTARIAIGVNTKRQLRQLSKRLNSRFVDETLGLYTAKIKKPGRVSIGLCYQLPRGNKTTFDLLLLPFAAESVSDANLEIIMSGQVRRIVSFTPFRNSTDDNIHRRLHVIAQAIEPPEKEAVPVTVVMLKTHGGNTCKRFADSLETKRNLYWNNSRRNRRIAEVAKQLALGKRKAILSVGVDDATTLSKLICAAKAGVVILVETVPHARELSHLLPNWTVSTANHYVTTNPKLGSGAIVTELAATESALTAGILIRATGTQHPLHLNDWPWLRAVEHGILIDFMDEYHSLAMQYSQARCESYQENGMTITTQCAKTNR